VIRQPLLIFSMLVAGASAALAQPSPNVSVVEECRAAANETVASLTAKRTALQAIVDRGAGAKPTPAVLKAQEDLIEVMFQMECVTTSAPIIQKRSIAKRTVAVAKPNIEIVTYYATNRKRTGKLEPVSVYGITPGDFHYGRAVVSIPGSHKEGEIEMPSLWRLETQANPDQHFVLKSVTPLELDAARKEMSDSLNSAKSKAVLLYVHGYNTAFTDAAMRAAQLAYDLKFPGIPMFYSWPSAGRVRSYISDEESAQLSQVQFEKLIDELGQLPVKDVYIVAHSMGTRMVAQGLQHRAEQNKPMQNLRELLLAAPDLNAELFKSVIAPKLAELQGLRTTVYASSSDLALKASKVVHGFPRLGETDGGNVFTFKGIETIDASGASNAALSLGHSYVVDTPSVIDDIKSVIMTKALPTQRHLKQAGAAPDLYWKLLGK
jgi:esterase/lipase superfamily enzyme